jgi:hypothetical protein
MVHSSAIIFAAMTLGVASTLAAPARAGRPSRGPARVLSLTAPPPAERRDLENDVTELFARGRRGGRGYGHKRGGHKHHHKKPAAEAAPPAAEAPAAERRDIEDDVADLFARDEEDLELFARGRRGGGGRGGRGHKHRHHKKPAAEAAPAAAEAPAAERRDIEDDVEDLFARDEEDVELFARGRRGGRGRGGRGHRHHHKKPAEAAPAEAPAAERRDIEDDVEDLFARDEREGEVYARGRRGGRERGGRLLSRPF